MSTAGPWDTDELFELQKGLCDELVNARRELALVEQSALRTRYETFRHLNDGAHNITTIREAMSDAASGFEVEAIGCKADVDGLTDQLRWVESRIAWNLKYGESVGDGDE